MSDTYGVLGILFYSQSVNFYNSSEDGGGVVPV